MTVGQATQRKWDAQDWKDFVHTGPGTLAGTYLRRFWQPVYLSEDLPIDTSVPIRIMSEDFTLYRGNSGLAHILDFRCAHRGTQLSTGWVEGDNIRCFYHGWLYDSSGQCVDQPAEPDPFSQKVRIRSYPTEEYLGLVFAYLGDGEAPPLPRYPLYDNAVIEPEFYTRACNYFQDLENDPVHGAFVHARGRRRPIPQVSTEESEWGMTADSTYPDGSVRITQWGLPNLHVVQTAPDGGSRDEWRDTMHWKVPIDDTHELSFRVNFVRVTGDAARRYVDQRADRKSHGSEAFDPQLSEAILAGKMHVREIFDRKDIYVVTVEDDVAQIGQGAITDRSTHRLGRSDVTVILFRKIWERELRALAEGRPLKQWRWTELTIPEDRGGLQRRDQPG